MANPTVAAVTPGEQAAQLFAENFRSQINDHEQFVEEGQVIRLNTPEQNELVAMFGTIVQNLPSTVDRSVLRNRTAALLANHTGSERELVRVRTMAGRLEGAFQTALAPGVQLNTQQATRSPTGIDLSQVTTAAAAAEVFSAVVGTHVADQAGFNVNEPAESPNARFNGERVRLTGPETNRIKSLIDELMARLPPDQLADFHRAAAEVLATVPNPGYEREVKFRDISKHLETSFQRIFRR